MANSLLSKRWFQRLIITVIGAVLTILGGYFIGTVVSKIIQSVDRTMLISGIVLFVVGIVLLWIVIWTAIKNRAKR